MKFMLTFLLFAAFGAQAEVLKPSATLTPTKAEITVQGMQVQYSIEDRGWFTRASFGGGQKKEMTAQKSYLLQYDVKSINKSANEVFEALQQDAREKCKELGEVDFKEVEKVNLPNWQMSHNETVNASLEPFFQGENSVAMRAVCLVTIDGK